MNLLILAALMVFSLVGCATFKDVRPGEGGNHRVSVKTDDPEEGSRDAIRQANNYCKTKSKEAVFMNENSKYTGDMDEKDYRNAKRVTTVAKSVGGAVWVFGGKTERDLGGLAGIGGTAVDQALGKGYTVEMQFKCQ